MSLANVIRNIREIRGQRLSHRLLDGIGRSEKVYPMKPDDWITVHSFGRLCPREEVICLVEDIVRSKDVDGRLLCTFRMGGVLGDMIRDKYLGPSGLLFGSWKCKGCGKVFGRVNNHGVVIDKMSGHIPMPVQCDQCKVSDFGYVEELIQEDKWRVRGHPDAFLKIGGERWIGEVKTVRSQGFRKLSKSPREEEAVDGVYLIQLRMYLWITKTKKGKFIYINKDATPFGNVDNYLWDIDIEHRRDVINKRVKCWIEVLREGLANRKVPKREMCTSPEDRRAQDCSVAAKCFEGYQ